MQSDLLCMCPQHKNPKFHFQCDIFKCCCNECIKNKWNESLKQQTNKWKLNSKQKLNNNKKKKTAAVESFLCYYNFYQCCCCCCCCCLTKAFIISTRLCQHILPFVLVWLQRWEINGWKWGKIIMQIFPYFKVMELRTEQK